MSHFSFLYQGIHKQLRRCSVLLNQHNGRLFGDLVVLLNVELSTIGVTLTTLNCATYRRLFLAPLNGVQYTIL